jgi:hypothetical protein
LLLLQFQPLLFPLLMFLLLFRLLFLTHLVFALNV